MTGQSILSQLVVEAVATEEGVESTGLSERLLTVVDPDALDLLFQAETGSLTFVYHGYEVCVTAASTSR